MLENRNMRIAIGLSVDILAHAHPSLVRITDSFQSKLSVISLSICPISTQKEP